MGCTAPKKWWSSEPKPATPPSTKLGHLQTATDALNRLGPGDLFPLGFLGAEQTAFEVLAPQIAVGISRSLGRRPDGELETFDDPVSEFTGPHNVFGSQHRHDAASEGYEIGVTPHLNSLGGTDFDAGETFPTLIRLLIVRLHLVGVQDHEVIWTNVHACSLVSTFTSIALFGDDKRWHKPPPY